MPKTLEKVTAKSVTKKTGVKLVSFTVRATIPVMAYGNIMPEIVVEAQTIEDAKSAVFPIIEELFSKYMEESRDGKQPRFLPNVTTKEKVVVTPTVTPGEKGNTTTPSAKDSIAPQVGEGIAKSSSYIKAENAINNAVSMPALDIVEEQIKNSVKISSDEKSTLYPIILKRRSELK